MALHVRKNWPQNDDDNTLAPLVASAATYYRDLGVVSMAAPPIAVCSGRGRTTGLIISVELPQCFDAALNVLIRYVVTELNI